MRINMCSKYVCIALMAASSMALTQASSAETVKIGQTPATPSATASLDSGAIAIQAAADRIATSLNGVFPDLVESYAETANGELELTTSGPIPADANSLISSLAGPVHVTFRRVNNAAAALRNLTSRITADRPYWKSLGVELATWGPDYATNNVVVALTTYSSDRAAMVLARYPGEPVSVAPQSTTLATRFGRSDDFSPWNGGDWTKNSTRGGYCTTGFNVYSSDGLRYVATAGHCGSVGDNFIVGPNSIGTMTSKAFVDGGNYDYSVIRADGVPAIWGCGTYGCWRNVASVGTADPVGTPICIDGAVFGEVCSVTITSLPICVGFDDGTSTCGLITAHKDGTNVSAKGDSGGPVETVDGTGAVWARGEIVGGKGDNTTVYYTPSRTIETLGIRIRAADRAVGGETLNQGDARQSPDGRFRVVMQTDGNLVVYQANTALWATSWLGVPTIAGTRAAMQTDGNFVMYTPSNSAIWSTNTYNRPGSRLIIQSDGNLVVYDSSGIARWQSGTGGH